MVNASSSLQSDMFG